MSEIIVSAEIRKDFGRKSRALRRLGKVPGIYYGHGQKNIAVALPEPALIPLFKEKATHIINLKLDDGSTHPCILREVQFDPVTEDPIHFDLYGVREDEELTIEVPVILTGAPKGVKDGGTLQHVLHKLRVSCLPKNLPDQVVVAVDHLEINRSIHVSDLTVPGVKILESGDSTVAAVIPPTVLKEETPTAEVAAVEAAPAEPEVIAKGKKAEEPEIPAPPEKK